MQQRMVVKRVSIARPRKSAAKPYRFFSKNLGYSSIVIILGLVSGLLFSLWQSGYVKQTYYMTNEKISYYNHLFSSMLGLILKDIYLEGQRYTPREQIIEKINLEEGQPIFSISLDEIKEDLENLNWVKEASIERHLPSTIHIKIIEKEPAAIWQNKGHLALIDYDGTVISKEHLSDFKNLPIVVGEDANLYVGKVIKTLSSKPDLFKKISAVIRIGGRRWNVKMDNNVEILLPEENSEAAWYYLSELQKEKRLLDRQIKSIDLRVQGKIYIKTNQKNTSVISSDTNSEDKKNDFDKTIDSVIGNDKED